MVMKHAGLHISDDAIRLIEYSGNGRALSIAKSGEEPLPSGVIDGGDIKDAAKLGTVLAAFGSKHGLSYVKASIPEEKAYLFQTEVPTDDAEAIAQNIEFKLEENVPLSAADAIFYFDLMPATEGGPLHASVTVVPRAYIEQLISILRGARIEPVSFEVLPKCVARSVIPAHSEGASIIVYVMKGKTGIYVVCGHVVCFASTIGWSASDMDDGPRGIAALTAEIDRVYTYWTSRTSMAPQIKDVVLVGGGAFALADRLRTAVAEAGLTVSVANVWQNAFDIDKNVPSIPFEQSLDFAAAAGLAMER